MRTRRLLLVLAAIVAVPAACVDSGERVAVLGDSITALDAEPLEADLGGDYRFTISGNFGMTAGQVAPEAEDLATRSYGQVIINLGTNDVLQGLPPQDAVSEIERHAAMFDSARCVHVVTVNEHMVDQRTGLSVAQGAQQLNEGLRALVDRDDRLRLIDWSAAAGESLGDSSPPTSTLTSDSIHPTPEGNEVLNGLYDDALAGCGPFD